MENAIVIIQLRLHKPVTPLPLLFQNAGLGQTQMKFGCSSVRTRHSSAHLWVRRMQDTISRAELALKKN